ncbi:hypothetical protein DAEQUDRAFT_677538 [Daedalea quercina L-15889]|uniref:Serine/threonine-protein kinase Tel1 n=1 Tax=Daedalea quercina L-15889 TaxID=1314783 RepID=A0A165LZG0_9APHY|nr:hypothetical protein DAEQUDRAFT_677538 [Daedalea quercina L-15889]
MSATIKNVLDLLRSEKVKDRQEGIAALHTVFAHESAILKVDAQCDGKAWIVIFQALFNAVVKEKEAYAKKGDASSPAVKRRLADAASAVRWLVERSVKRMNSKVVKAVFAHFEKYIIYRGELFIPVALQYVKAIRCILSYVPHLEHLAEEKWITFVEMSLNVILGDRVKKSLGEEEDTFAEEREDIVLAESGMEDSGEDSALSIPGPSSPRKRRLPSATQIRRTPFSASPAPSTHPVTQEQVEFMSLLVLLLQSSSAPLLSPQHPYLPSALFNRLARILQTYPGDSSLHHDYLLALSAALSHVALNDSATVTAFAYETWDALLSMWGTKNQRMKQDLVLVLQTLFPYFTVEPVDEMTIVNADYADGVAKLLHLLSGEADSRWGVDGLSLDRLRLAVRQLGVDGDSPQPFVGSTFQYGWQFDPGQALAWTILELQADCTAKLYKLTESVHSMDSSSSRRPGKRVKLENPIKSQLDLISRSSVSSIRSYHLQGLLFFIDRHWSTLHEELQQQVISVLLQFVSFEDGSVQSWTLLCLAAIAQTVGSSIKSSSVPGTRSEPPQSATWDAIFAHAMRRSTTASVSRAACHVASVFMLHSKELLTSQRLIAEVEALCKDLDVQGPVFPYDSVCAFLDLALRIASQDARLYRMQMEEKVLTWFLDTWRVETAPKTKLLPHTMADLLMLLESICSLSNKSHLICGMPLSDTPVVQAANHHCYTAVIRNFTLQARLPPWHRPEPASDSSSLSGQNSEGGRCVDLDDLVEPRGRERRISTFLLKIMEEVCTVWESGRDVSGFVTAEKIRSYLDTAFMVLSFEATLVVNGVRPTRRVIQAACRLIQVLFPHVSEKRWTSEERLLMLGSLEPLILVQQASAQEPIESLASPGPYTGIRREVLRGLGINAMGAPDRHRNMHRLFQRTIFRSVDVQDTFNDILDSLRSILRLASGVPGSDGLDSQAMDVDVEDDFGQLRTAQDVGSSSASSRGGTAFIDMHGVETCMAALAVIPILQSTSVEPTRDRDLANLVIGSDESRFLEMAYSYFTIVRAGSLTISGSTMKQFLAMFDDLWPQYDYARNDRLHRLSLHFLHSTMAYWMDPATPGDICDSVRHLWSRLAAKLLAGKMTSWRTRDAVILFLDASLAYDPQEQFWTCRLENTEDPASKPGSGQDGNEKGGLPFPLPAYILPKFGADDDIRTRFRAAAATARMFSRAYKLGQSLQQLYNEVRPYLTIDYTAFEKMLTRIICLADMMVVSSAVRRGAYWHLLEGCLFEPMYASYAEAALTSVSERLGLSGLAELFEHYASQTASSICASQKDFLNFPHRLLGFKERRQCAEVAFHAFTPANLLTVCAKDPSHGNHLFRSHCKAIHKPPADGLKECFPEIVGYGIVIAIGKSIGVGEDIPHDLEAQLRDIVRDIEQPSFDIYLHRAADVIAATIVRTLGDQDVSRDGMIYKGIRLAGFDEESITVLDQLVQLRHEAGFHFHEPNFPFYSTEVVLKALRWFSAWVPEAESPAVTYHVLHQLFADMERCPFINEQMRLLNGICVWVATRSRHFEDSTLLRTLMNMTSTIIAQMDMARAAQSILQWGFGVYRRATKGSNHLSDLLVRLGSTAQDYQQASSDGNSVTLGQDLARWTEATMQILAERTALQSHITRAMASWPFDTSSPTLLELRDSLSLHEISRILSDPPVTTNKFRLARRIHDLAVGQQNSNAYAANSHFWRLKQCIPSYDRLHDEDIDAFVLLLIHNGGVIRSPERTGTEVATQTVRERHRQFSSSVDQADADHAAMHAIVLSLLEMLDASSAAQIHIAYRTLRCVMSVRTFENSASQALYRDYAGDLLHLRAHPVVFTEDVSEGLPQLLAGTPLLQASRDFPTWISNLTTSLCGALATEDRFYAALGLSIGFSTAFAENIMPVLVHALLCFERSSGHANGGEALRLALSAHFDAVLRHEDADVRCLHAIIDTVLHLRHFHPPGVGDALAYDSWLQMDYRLLGKESIKCDAYTTALLFLELAAEGEAEEVSNGDTAEDTLFDVYSRIDEPDGFYGIRASNLSDFLIKRLHHEKQWDSAFRYHGAALAAHPSDSTHAQGIVRSLHAFGFDRLAMTALGSISSPSQAQDNSQSDMMYELGWRTGIWDLPECRAGQYPGASMYMSLRAVHRERDSSRVDAIIRRSLFQELTQLHSEGNENLTGIRHIAQNLMCLRQIRWWRNELLPLLTKRTRGQPHDCVWDTFSTIDGIESFDDAESVMATRISLIHARRQKEERDQIGDLLSPLGKSLIELERNCLLRLSQAARKANKPQAALNAVTRAQALGQHATPQVAEEFANVLWHMKEPRMSASLLKDTLSRINSGDPNGTQENKVRTATVLARLGTWSAQASLDKPDAIVEQFFHPATQLLSDATATSNAAEYASVFHQYAIFTDHQYHSVVNSPDVLRWRVYMDRKTEEVKFRKEQMQRVPPNTQQYRGHEHALSKAKKELGHDQARFKEYMDARDRFLTLAMTSYSQCLAHSEEYDNESIIRLCSLWMANFDRTDTSVNFEAALQRVASHKFIFLAHQLTARLSKPASSRTTLPSQSILHTLLTRMCREHPFHSLYQVFCLISEQSSSRSAAGRRQSGRLEGASSQAERAAAASTLFDQLKTDVQVQGRIHVVEQLWRASLQWAMYPKDKVPARGSHHIPEEMAIRKIRSLRVPVVTAHTPVDPTCQYNDCAWVNHFEATYTVAGGLNRPKITICVAEDGTQYKQLYKGGDDLRQDAVMEQVFELVNIILCRDRETRRRDLAVRGYKVVPLASQAGVLEFVSDTTPLATWLIRAHQRYRPGDIRPYDAQEQLSTKQKKCDNDRGEMLALFLKLRQRFRPVMRHYFTERHKDPMAWFTMRLKYSRSVATTSIVGHILGLGDRHISNILLDNNTGEVIHIDLGIAFDQGKMLQVPERVPFRLTADVVDGLGTSGTQGVFQRCAEETLRVLRDESEVILTVLEVFKYDPLHSWVASEVKMKRVQGIDNDATLTGEAVRLMIGIDMASGTADEAADRALSAVRRRLDKTLSVEFTVNELVAEATDPVNLAQMFCGECAFRARSCHPLKSRFIGWSPHL